MDSRDNSFYKHKKRYCRLTYKRIDNLPVHAEGSSSKVYPARSRIVGSVFSSTGGRLLLLSHPRLSISSESELGSPAPGHFPLPVPPVSPSETFYSKSSISGSSDFTRLANSCSSSGTRISSSCSSSSDYSSFYS